MPREFSEVCIVEKEFPTTAALSLSTGIMCGPFSEMHQLAECLAGHPIWTHEFADNDLLCRLQREMARQIPGLPGTEVASQINEQNVLEFIEKWEGLLGKLVSVSLDCDPPIEIPDMKGA